MNRSSVYLSIAALFLIVFTLYSVSEILSVYILEISYADTDAKNPNRIFWTRVNSEDTFSLVYTNSVQQCQIVDDFQINRDHEIVLISTTFPDHGAGIPFNSQYGGVFSVQKDGKFRISDMRLQIPEILLRVEREYNNVFIFGDCQIDLSEICGHALLIVHTRKYSFLKHLYRRIFNAGQLDARDPRV
jgi:hypothetical protein